MEKRNVLLQKKEEKKQVQNEIRKIKEQEKVDKENTVEPVPGEEEEEEEDERDLHKLLGKKLKKETKHHYKGEDYQYK